MLFEFLQWDDYAIVFSNSLNSQNDFFKLGENTRKIERIKETDSVRFLGIWLDTKLNFNDYFKKAVFFYTLCYEKNEKLLKL